ncbi:hypothetical protein NL676_023646 [Syzygium grande]|nr:hypothetical protein NL676_023646 [Syzygium grande]
MATASSSSSSPPCAVEGLRRLPQLPKRRHSRRLRQPPPRCPPPRRSPRLHRRRAPAGGETISLSLERAIESSGFAIVVFSPNFAASTWCLQELTKILEMRGSRGQLVRPVFLRVDPSDVRKQTGVFAEIMARHEEFFGGDGSERMKKWGDALREAANLSGWHLGHGWLDVHGNNLPATVESNGPAQPCILDSSPTKPAKNEKHHDFASQVIKKFSKAELVRATNNFSDDNKIGVGSAGTVYRGILDDGREVAIKWTYATRKAFEGIEFITKIKTLRHVNHENLIRLLGFHARHRECALVYEYMNSSSLYYHLHTIGSSTLMSWNARLKVALDVAREIEYLHEFAGHITVVIVPRTVEEEIGKALDPNMPIPATSKMMVVEYMAYLTVDCVQIEAGNRPSMTDVVDRLRSA